MSASENSAQRTGLRPLLVASRNRKKLEELMHFFSGLEIRLLSLADFPHAEEVPEDGRTFAENAALKAVGYARQAGCLTIAEDSGLCCDALDGAPGVFSARFAGEAKSDLENNNRLLSLLRDVPEQDRGAHYVCSIAMADPQGIVGAVEGDVHGTIAREARGQNGFGYDPLFYYPPFGKTFGEVAPDLKNRVSHRARAFAKAKGMVEDYLRLNPERADSL